MKIPDGGVHIVGGEDGDAFIAFASDEDARQAMRMSGKEIHNKAVDLFLSSKVEMSQVIADARLDDAEVVEARGGGEIVVGGHI